MQPGATLRAEESTRTSEAHKRPDGTWYYTAFKDALSNIGLNNLRENLAYMYCDTTNGRMLARDAFDSWMTSSGHEAVLMSAETNIQFASGIAVREVNSVHITYIAYFPDYSGYIGDV